MPPTGPQPDSVLFEAVRLGSVLKITAIDPASGVEASVVVPVGTTQMDAQRLALRKLMRILSGPQTTPPAEDAGGGILV